MTSDSTNQINAGLPNITGEAGTWGDNNCSAGKGALKFIEGSWTYKLRNGGEANLKPASIISLNASNSNSLYGASDTVQPPAYKIYAWKRIS